MKNLSTITLNFSTEPDKWVSKCYVDGQIETVQTFATAKEAHDWAADWVSFMNDNTNKISENN